MLKIRPISPSEFWVWKNNREEYYKKYILLEDTFIETEKMKLGTAIHLAFEGGDFIEYIKENNIEKHREIIEKILQNELPIIPEKEVWLGEYGKYYEETDCYLSGRADGIDKENNIIYEIKTSRYHWNNYLLNQNKAVVHYSFLYKEMFKIIPKIKLISCSTKDGSIKILERNIDDNCIKNYLKEVKEMVSELKKLEWYEKRKSTYKKTQHLSPSVNK